MSTERRDGITASSEIQNAPIGISAELSLERL